MQNFARRRHPGGAVWKIFSVPLWPLVTSVVCWVPGTVFAQTIAPIADIAVSRVHEAEDRPSVDAHFDISREDCLAGDVLTFDLDIMGPDTSSSFVVWASDGDDCTEEDNRRGDDPRCWLVHRGTLGSTSERVSIPVQNIAARRLPTETGGDVSVGTLDIQSVTSIQDQTLTFVPKIVAMTVVAAVLMPWIVARLVEFTAEMFRLF
jgi:flagellar biosynthetic protein FliQ